ncbi:hypothetical protein GCM10027402_27850 [Arthrobacter monumenti]
MRVRKTTKREPVPDAHPLFSLCAPTRRYFRGWLGSQRDSAKQGAGFGSNRLGKVGIALHVTFNFEKQRQSAAD